MNKKVFSLAATVVFLVSSSACIPVKSKAKISPGRLSEAQPYKTKVVAIQKKTGERLAFPRKAGVTIAGEKVIIPIASPGTTGSLREKLPLADVEEIGRSADGRITHVATRDGRFFRITEAREDGEGIEIRTAVFYRFIPLSDVDLVWVRKTNWGLTIAASTGLWVAAAAVVALAVGDDFMKFDPWSGGDVESCPFVYSFDGKEYVLDAEPYGGSVCAGLERADWVGLDSLEPVDGRYRLLLTNELEEVEHVDELKLVVVDHPAGVSVFPEVSGRMRTVATTAAPQSARDAGGRDVLPLLGAKDGTFWLGRVEGRDPDRDEDLKEELILEFAKPAGAKSAKLVANAWTTQWGSQAIKPLLTARGRELESYFDRVDAGGPALLSLLGWFAREEMYNLQVRVETTVGWKTKALVHGGGPVIAKDKVYELDLRDVPGDTVRIKLTPAAGFWMIDRLALDFSEDETVRVTEIAAVSASDASGRNIGAELALDDNSFFVIPKGSRPATLEFAVPPEAPGMARAVFLKARGYYDILLDSDGEPTLDVDRMMETPGESLRYLLSRHPALAKPGPRAPEHGPRAR